MKRSLVLGLGCLFLTLGQTMLAKEYSMPDPKKSLAAQKTLGGKSVTYSVENTNISANLYLPENVNSKSPAIVVVTPQGGLKEQTAGIYALNLAKKGFVTIAFDHRTYGQSGGEPRHYESPQWKAEDIKGAVSYLGTLPYVDKEKIGVLAICSGAGYGVLASVNDARVKAFSTVSGVFNFRERETGLNDITEPTEKQLKTFREKMKISADARQKYFETGIMTYTPLVPDLTPTTSDFWAQGYDYYRTERGFIDGWENKRSAHSFEARFSANTSSHNISQLNDLGTPFLAIAGDKAFTYPFSVKSVDRAKGNKELFTIKGATHFDLYDNPKYYTKAVEKLDTFFTTYLDKK